MYESLIHSSSVALLVVFAAYKAITAILSTSHVNKVDIIKLEHQNNVAILKLEHQNKLDIIKLQNDHGNTSQLSAWT